MKNQKIKLFLVLIIVNVVIAACQFPLTDRTADQPTATIPGIETTQSAQMTQLSDMATYVSGQATNVGATLMALPTNTPMPTSTTLPTNTPPPTKTPTRTPVPAPCNTARFEADLTIVDQANLPQNSLFTKIWRLKNVGACTWTKDYEVSFDGGDKLDGTTVSMPKSVAPGEFVDVSIPMQAPNTIGEFKGYWILRDGDGRKFGLGESRDVPFYVEIAVVDATGGSEYNFADNVCQATWKTDTHIVPCMGNPAIYSNYVYFSNTFDLEDGRTEDEAAIIVNVEEDIRLRSNFPAYKVNTGDRFVAEIGCLDSSTDCKVTMKLRYRISGTSTSGVLAEWTETHDGVTTMIDIDLSSLVGEPVIFKLEMEAESSSDTNEVFWFMPSIRN